MPDDPGRSGHSIEELYGTGALSDEDVEALLDQSLHPRGPDMLFDLAGELGLSASHRVLDVGCRDGRQQLEMVGRFGCRTVGLEPVPANLDRGRDLLASARQEQGPDRTDRVSVVQGVAERLPFADGTFDFLWCRDVLIHVLELEKALRECRRVLRPGAPMLVFQMFATSWLDSGEAERLWPPLAAVPANTDPQRFERAVAASGFRVARTEELHGEWREHGEETGPGRTSRQLLHAARLTRDPERYVAALGRDTYESELADALWGIYQMIGKLSPRIYVLS
jgi:ubiquinone/menaquinone biosynthesis C-methylase UbiE